MSKVKKRIISSLLLASLLAVYSCGDTSAKTDATSSSDTETSSELAETTEAELRDSLPDDLDYGQKTITMFVNGSLSYNEFDAEANDGDVVNDAIWNRNRDVSERLNVNYEFVKEPGLWADRQNFAKKISKSISANESAYDIVAGYSMAIASLAADGMLTDLTGTKYIDLEKPWWSKNLMGQSSVGEKLYFASGDISDSLLYNMMAVLFNKELMADNNVEEPYQLVFDGKWTLDKLIEMSTGVYRDLNGNSEKDVDSDIFGLDLFHVYTDAFFFASGLRTTEMNADGIPEISPLFGSEKTQALIEKLCGFIYGANDAFLVDENTELKHSYFETGRFMFSPHEVLYASTNLRNSKFDYGILPIPKYDEAQDEYYTIASFPYTLYGIPVDAPDADMSSAVLEALASESSRTVMPAVFEVALKVKYTSDDSAAQVYDIIRNSMTYDFGRVFTDNMNALTYSLFRDAVRENNSNWMSTYARDKNTLENKMNKLVEKFTERE